MKLFMNVMTQASITLVAVSGIYVLTGLTGMFSLGSAAFMAIGAYVSGLLVMKLSLPIWLAFIIGYLIGYPVVRLRRDYISLVTLGFGESVAQLLIKMSYITGGANGLIGIPRKVKMGTAVTCAVIAIAIVALFITVDPEDVDAIAGGLKQLFEEPPEARAARVARGLEWVRKFSWVDHAAGIVRLLGKANEP